MIVTTKKLFAAAYGKYAIGAYNINNLEQTMGLFQGNLDSQAQFIIQISKGTRSYSNKLMLEGLIRAADEALYRVKNERRGSYGEAHEFAGEPHAERI